MRKSDLPAKQFIARLGIHAAKWHSWKDRYGKVNEHNARIPRDHWIEPHEKQAILDYHERYPHEGYRRLTFVMLDEDVVAVSPSSVYRILSEAGRLGRKPKGNSSKGTGFVQPLTPHQHWHVDVAYLNIAGTFYYLCSVLDGCSRSVVHWEIRGAMTEADVLQIIQRGPEAYPNR